MVRISLLTISATLLLVGCSGSSRVEDIVPAWANSTAALVNALYRTKSAARSAGHA